MKINLLLLLIAVILSFVVATILYIVAYINITMSPASYAMLAAFSSISVLLLLRKRPIWIKVAGMLAYALMVYFAWSTSGNTRRPFLRDLYSIRPGMTVSQVRSKMSRWFEQESKSTAHMDPVTGRSVSRSAMWVGGSGLSNGTGTLIFQHSHSKEFGGDWGMVGFSNGKVVGVTFSPD